MHIYHLLIHLGYRSTNNNWMGSGILCQTGLDPKDIIAVKTFKVSTFLFLRVQQEKRVLIRSFCSIF